jgi:TRAP-type C4-dicarboxylate transport system substrate-binding protein
MVGCILLWAAGAQAQELKLRAGSFVPPNSTFGALFKMLIDDLNEKGKGQFQVELLGPSAVPPFELGNAVGTGVIDIACVPTSYYKGKMPESDTLTLANIPYAELRRNGGWEAINKLHNQKMNAWYLTAFGDGLKYHVFVNKPVNSVADLNGIRIRSAPLYNGFLKSVGTNPVNIPPGEMYTALERGTVDAYAWPLGGIHDEGWHRYTKVRIDPGFFNVAAPVLVNLPKWRAMTDRQREIFTKAALDWETAYLKWRENYLKVEQEKQNASGIRVVDLGPEWAKKADDALIAELRATNAKDVDELLRLTRR